MILRIFDDFGRLEAIVDFWHKKSPLREEGDSTHVCIIRNARGRATRETNRVRQKGCIYSFGEQERHFAEWSTAHRKDEFPSHCMFFHRLSILLY